MSTPDKDSEQTALERDSIEQTVESYLDGQLDPEETARFERRLVDPEVAHAFGEALMLRQLLADLPPNQAPEELVRQLEAALEVDPGAQRRSTRLLRLRAALDGMSWVVRGPAQALGTARASTTTALATAGLSTMRYALGPLALGKGSAAPGRKPWWRRALARGLRPRGKRKE